MKLKEATQKNDQKAMEQLTRDKVLLQESKNLVLKQIDSFCKREYAK